MSAIICSAVFIFMKLLAFFKVIDFPSMLCNYFILNQSK